MPDSKVPPSKTNTDAAGHTREELSLRQLQRVLTRSDDFCFCVLICGSPRSAASLVATLAQRLALDERRPLALTRVDPYEHGGEWLRPAQLLQEVLEPLLAEASDPPAADTVHVVDASRALPHDDEAWADLFRQMNECRNDVAENLARPLLLCLPPHLEKLLVHTAPDIWAARRLVVGDMSRWLPHGRAIAKALKISKTQLDFGLVEHVEDRLSAADKARLGEALEAVYAHADEMVEMLREESFAISEDHLKETVLWLAEEWYLKRLADQFVYSDFRGIEQLEKLIPLELDDVFVDLRVRDEDAAGRDHERETELRKRLDSQSSEYPGNSEEGDLQRYSPPSIPEERQRPSKGGKLFRIDRVLEDPGCVVLLGGPGSGKTTLLKQLARTCALGRKAVRRRFPAMPWCMPIFLPIGVFEDRCDTRALAAFLRERLEEMGGRVLVACYERRWSAGECLVLLDGLDEVIGSGRRIARARDVADLVQNAGNNRVLVTSRPVGYSTCRLPTPARHVSLQPFEHRDVETFVRQWHRAYHRTVHPAHPDPARAQAEAQQLNDDIERNPRVASLATNPLMLTIIALIKQHNVTLPERRVGLYEIVLNTLIRSWNKARTQGRMPEEVGEELGLEETKKIWAAVAYWMHREHAAGTCSRHQIREKLVEVLVNERELPRPRAERTAESYLRSAAERSGLIEERGANVFAFMHQTFQEYLAAQNLWLRRPRAKAIERVLDVMNDPRWHEVIRLTAGFIGVIQQDDEMATDLVTEIAAADYDPLEPFLCNSLRLAASCLADDVRVKPRVASEIVRLMCQRVQEVPYDEVIHALSDSLEAMRTHHPDEQTAQSLLGLRNHKSWRIRQEAVRMLSRVAGRYPKVAEGLLEFLEDGDPDVRALAALSLWRIGRRLSALVHVILLGSTSDVAKESPTRDPELAAAFVELLDEGNAMTRRQVAAALGTWGPQAQATPVLLTLLEDEDASVRYRAVLALKNWEPRTDVVMALLKRINDPDSHVLTSAVSVLGSWSYQAEAAPILLGYLKSEDPFVRHGAASVLGKWGPQAEVTTDLLSLLKDKAPFVRHGAATVLGYWGSHAEEEAIPALLNLLDDKDSYVRYSSASILGNWGHRAKGTSVLLKLLEDESASIRYGAVMVLGEWGPQAAARSAMAKLLGDESSSVRYRVAATLGKWGHQKKATATLLELLRDDNAYIRTKATKELGDWGPQTSARPVLLELMKAQEAYVRNSAAAVLARWGYHEEATSALLAILNEESDANVRMNAVEVLRNWRHEAPVAPTLLSILKSADPFVRMSALEELGKWSPQPGTTLVLVELLADKAAGVRRSAAEVLRNWGGNMEAARAVLPKLLGDTDVEPALEYLAQTDPTPPEPETARLLAQAVQPRPGAPEAFRLRQEVVFGWLWRKAQITSI